jgi:type III restriction enzyme
VVESKGTMGMEFLRPAEKGKIECGKKHFEELSQKSGKQISLIHASTSDDFINYALSK